MSGAASVTRVGVVSDTHLPRFGAALPAALVAGLRAARVAFVIHCGDFTGPHVPELFDAIAPLVAVAGNNDPPELVRRFGRLTIVPIAGCRIGIVHGDAGRGRTTVERARNAFPAGAVDVICFGHSHAPLCEERDGVLLLNPGSPTDKRRQPRYSYALLEIGERVRARIVAFDRSPAVAPIGAP